MIYEHLQFFDKNGYNLNFDYNAITEVWEGKLFCPRTSVDLVEICDFYLMERVIGASSGPIEFVKPHIYGSAGGTAISIYWEDDSMDDFILYSYDEIANGPTLTTLTGATGYFDVDATEIVAGGTGSTAGMKITSTQTLEAVKVNIAFYPKSEDNFYRTLYLKEVENDRVFATIELYGESEDNDERLDVLIKNFGEKIDSWDERIFDVSDVNEKLPDYILLNRKRKELLLEFANIFPLVGSYKALINIINFFGYKGIVQIKEYWKNIDQGSELFGKFRKVPVNDLYEDRPGINFSEGIIPSKVYLKTNKFGLFYQVTTETGEYDDDGLPIVEETFTFSQDEVLIKMFAFKKKLKDEFLPLNARIVDIIGEISIYQKYDINIWLDSCRIEMLQAHITPTIEIDTPPDEFMISLIPLQYLGCPIGADLMLGPTGSNTDYAVHRWTPGTGATGELYELSLSVGSSAHTVGITLEIPTSPRDIGEALVAEWNNSTDPILSTFNVFMGSTAGPEFWAVETTAIGASPIGTTGSFDVIDLNIDMGATAISYYADCFIGYFDDLNLGVDELFDTSDTPVGYPIVLRNTSFEMSWDDSNIQWDSIDENISFDTYGNCNFYAIRWIVTKPEDDTPEFSYDTGWQEDLILYGEIPLILPYTGDYKIELQLQDLYDGRSTLICNPGVIVRLPSVDFVGIYGGMDVPEYTWDNLVRDDAQLYELGYLNRATNTSHEYTWDEYESSWELPFFPKPDVEAAVGSYEALDLIEHYQQMTFDDATDDPRSDITKYTWDMLGNGITWDDLWHTWWNYAGNPYSRFNITGIGSTGAGTGLTGPILAVFPRNEHTYDAYNACGTTADMSSIYSAINSMLIVNDNGDGSPQTYINNGNAGNGNWAIYDIDLDYLILDGSASPTFAYESIERLNYVDATDNAYLSKFIYYVHQYVEIGLTGSTSETGVSRINAISKDSMNDKEYWVEIIQDGATSMATSTNHVYEMVNYGSLGDIPAHFEIHYLEGGTSTITIDDYDTYTITATTLAGLFTELNGSTSSGIVEFEYNQIIDSNGDTLNIIAIPLDKTVNEIDIVFENIIGTPFGRKIVSNPTWSSVRFAQDARKIPVGTRVLFTYENCGIKGKVSGDWTIKSISDDNVTDFTHKNKFFSFVFNNKGRYSVELEIEDGNGNKQLGIKNEMFIVE